MRKKASQDKMMKGAVDKTAVEELEEQAEKELEAEERKRRERIRQAVARRYKLSPGRGESRLRSEDEIADDDDAWE